MSFDKEFQVVHTVFSNEKSDCKYIKTVNDLRYFKDIVNMDDGLIIDFASVPDQIKSFVMFCKVKNVASYSNETEIKKIKNSAYGL